MAVVVSRHCGIIAIPRWIARGAKLTSILVAFVTCAPLRRPRHGAAGSGDMPDGKSAMARRQYLDEMAATLGNWATQILDLQAKAQSAGDEQQFFVSRQMAALQRQRTEYAARMNDMRDMSGDGFTDMRKSTERMAAEFRKTYVQAASRFAP
jgi:hypothetical protein